MKYYPGPGSHIRDKIKVVLDLSNFVTKKKLEHAAGVDTFNWAAKKDFVVLRAQIDKLGINKLVNVPTSNSNNLEIKVDQLDVGELKTIPVDLKN